jgi:hypothetical protein
MLTASTSTSTTSMSMSSSGGRLWLVDRTVTEQMSYVLMRDGNDIVALNKGRSWREQEIVQW